MSNIRLGIDIGGSGIKGALIDLESGELLTDRVKLYTPQPAVPATMGEAVGTIVRGFDYDGPVGVGFPAVVREGIVSTANNIDPEWVGTSAVEVFGAATGLDVSVVNDADAAALCEARYGVARNRSGLVIVLTFGTGIGSGFLVGGELVPNVELGMLELEGHSPAETFFSAKARSRQDLSWGEWGSRVNRFLTHVTRVFSPELIAVGGGVARKWDKWEEHIDQTLPVVRAERANNAGIVGAATIVG
ncbi:MAG: ROK family protein [Actinomycetota bacterium]|nr:ROK family protein [Actinomycetota bacterium]